MIILSALTLATVLPIGQFRSIASSNGAHVVVRFGPVQRVTIDGDARCVSVRVDENQRLFIDKRHHDCRREELAQIGIVTPTLSAITVSNGGTVQATGAFPAQRRIDVAVEQGGTIDIRSIDAEHVEASVNSGGRIFTNTRKTLSAMVESGGVITYWGNPEDFRKSVHNGGVVKRGSTTDWEQPISSFR